MKNICFTCRARAATEKRFPPPTLSQHLSCRYICSNYEVFISVSFNLWIDHRCFRRICVRLNTRRRSTSCSFHSTRAPMGSTSSRLHTSYWWSPYSTPPTSCRPLAGCTASDRPSENTGFALLLFISMYRPLCLIKVYIMLFLCPLDPPMSIDSWSSPLLRRECRLCWRLQRKGEGLFLY